MSIQRLYELSENQNLICEITFDASLPITMRFTGSLALDNGELVFRAEAAGVTVTLPHHSESWNYEPDGSGGVTISKEAGRLSKFVRVAPQT